MDNIILCSNNAVNYTWISNTFIEKYMLGANGSYVKVYLYLAKCMQAGGANLSISSLADQMENTEKDILRALKYWDRTGLIRLTYDDNKAISSIYMENPDIVSYQQETEKPVRTKDALQEKEALPAGKENSSLLSRAGSVITQTETTAVEREAAAVQIETAATTQADSSSLRVQKPSDAQLEKLSADEKFTWLTSIVSTYLGRLLNEKDSDLLIFLYETLGFSTDLILHLYNYCISQSKTNPSYIEKVAIAWAEKGVKTIDDAKAISARYTASYQTVCRAFGISRSLGEIERTYIDKWTKELKLETALITEACNRTLLHTGKADFKYTDRILSNWHEAGLRTLSDIAAADKDFSEKQEKAAEREKTARATTKGNKGKGTSANQFQSFPQREYSKEDAEALEQKLLQLL